jgi:hypothetical protein
MKSSGLQGTSALIFTGHCRLLGVSLAADVDKTLTITVYDKTSAAGTVVAFGRASGASLIANKEFGAHTFVIKFSRDDNMFCENGLYAAISAEEGDYVIYYEIM